MKKIAIVGFSRTEHEAPYLNNEWEIWSLNHRLGVIDRFDKWFNIHTLQALQPCDALYQFYQNLGPNLITCKENLNKFPQATPYPLEQILEKYSNVIISEKQATDEKKENKQYLTNSIAVMLAYALVTYPDLTDLGIWGVDMLTVKEYQEQLPGLMLFIGACLERGIKIHIPEECELFRKVKFYYNIPG